MSYYTMSGKHVERFFVGPTGANLHGGRQAHLAQLSWHIRSRHDLQPQEQLRSYRLVRRFTRHQQPEEGEAYIRENVLSLWGILHFGARVFCDNKGASFLEEHGSYNSRSKHLAIRFMRLCD